MKTLHHRMNETLGSTSHVHSKHSVTRHCTETKEFVILNTGYVSQIKILLTMHFSIFLHGNRIILIVPSFISTIEKWQYLMLNKSVGFVFL